MTRCSGIFLMACAVSYELKMHIVAPAILVLLGIAVAKGGGNAVSRIREQVSSVGQENCIPSTEVSIFELTDIFPLKIHIVVTVFINFFLWHLFQKCNFFANDALY